MRPETKATGAVDASNNVGNSEMADSADKVAGDGDAEM